MAKKRSAGGEEKRTVRTATVATRRPPARDVTVPLKMSPQEHQLIAYAASKSRARGIQIWMRERLIEAAREKVPEKTVEEILEGKATLALLKESLKEARGATREASKVLAFKGRGRQEAE